MIDRKELGELATKHRVPGVSLAVLKDGQIDTVSAGVVNINTGVEVTDDTVFLIGSNSKIYTATGIMQLVQEGRLELDAPVTTYLPTFTLADADATERVTVRHLLTHTSGIEGDYFIEFGRGDDATERLVDSLSTIGLVHPLDAVWSYCNTGWVILGRITEVLCGTYWHEAIRERILDPAGLNDSVFAPDETMLRRAAVGHIDRGDGVIRVTSTYLLPRAMAAAGSVIATTAADLLRFTKLHLDGKSDILGSDATAAMQQPHPIVRPWVAGNPKGEQGLGWMLANYGDTRIVMHGGGTTGQRSFLETAPDRGLAIAMLTNGPGGDALWQALAPSIWQEIGQITRTPMPKPPETPPDIDLSLYTGTYENFGVVATIELHEGALRMKAEPRNNPPNPDVAPPAWVPLQPIDDVHFLVNGGPIEFQLFDEGRPAYVNAGRAFRRRPT